MYKTCHLNYFLDLFNLFLILQPTFVNAFYIPSALRNCTIQIIVDFKFLEPSFIPSLLYSSNGVVLDDYSKNSTKYYFPRVYETFQKSIALSEPTENKKDILLSELIFHSRQGSCNTAMIMLSSLKSVYKQQALWGILLGMAIAGENPHYILVEIEITDGTFPADLHGFSVTSIFLVFYKNSSTLLMPKIPNASNSRFQLLSASQVKSLQSLRQAWMNLNKNLRGSRVLFISKYSVSESLKTCSFSQNKYYTPPYECTLRILSFKFNYSEYTAYHQHELKEKPFSFLLQGPVRRDINGLLVQHKVFGHNWIVHGVSYEPYEFIVFTTYVGMSFYSVVSGVDLYIWGAVGITLGILFFFVLVIDGVQSLGLFVAWIVTSILEQMDDAIARKLFHKRFWMVSPALACWLFSILILGSIYKGEMFSVMIATGLPAVPLTLRDLIESNLSVVTFSTEGWTIVPNDPMMNDSYLKTSIIPDLILDIDATEPFYQFMVKVQDKTQFIRGNAWDVASKIVINFIKNSSESIAIIDSSSNLEDIIKSVGQLTTELKPVKNHDINPFTIRKPWIGKRNYFYVEFAKSLGSLVQAGIYYKWEQNFHFKIWTDNMKNSNADKQIPNKSYQEVPRLQGNSRDSSVLFPESNPIELAIVKPIFLLHLALCAICLITLFVEIVYNLK